MTVSENEFIVSRENQIKEIRSKFISGTWSTNIDVAWNMKIAKYELYSVQYFCLKLNNLPWQHGFLKKQSWNNTVQVLSSIFHKFQVDGKREKASKCCSTSYLPLLWLVQTCYKSTHFSREQNRSNIPSELNDSISVLNHPAHHCFLLATRFNMTITDII